MRSVRPDSSPATGSQQTLSREIAQRRLSPAQSECHKGVAGFGAELAGAAGGDEDVLAAADHIGRRRGVAADGEIVLPERLARFLVERAKALVFGGGDKDEAAGGDNRAAEGFRAGLRDAAGFQFRV